MTTKNIAIIGGGNMGVCLLGGLIKMGYAPEKIWVADPSTERLNALKHEFKQHIHFTTNNLDAVKTAEIILFAVKPMLVPVVATELADIVKNQRPLIISIAAGVTIKVIQHVFDGKSPIVRAMPNTPAMIGCGITALFANEHVTHEQKNNAESILRAVGSVVWVENEILMDAVTAVSGSGPAYFFLVIEALQKAAEQVGLTKDVARLLTLETAYGAACMALESDKTVMELRKQVTSPGGTTEAAIRVLEDAKIRESFANAVSAANKRAEEIAHLLEKETEV